MPKGKGNGGGGEGGTSSSNLTSIILGAITIVLSLIGLGIAMDTIAPYLTGGGAALNWTRYPGGEPMLKLFPLIMLVGLVLFGGLMVWMGTKGKKLEIKDTVLVVIVVVVSVIMLPIVMDACDNAYENVNAASFTGLTQFLGLVPLIYTVALMFISGLLGKKMLSGA